jgi:hypothetical protein
VDCTTVAVGTYNATLVVADNATPSTQTATLTCNVTGVPQATLAPSSLIFTTTVGTTAASQSLTLSNPGTATLTIASTALSGANASSFSIAANACGTSLAAGASCPITVGCTATALGTYTGNLTVSDNATSTRQTSSLSCTVSGTPQATVTPVSYNFGSVNVGATTPATTISVSNPGTAPLTITSINLTGANAASFTIASNSCGATLAAGASCAVNVTFSPTAGGGLSVALNVVDSIGTQTSTLAGTGTVPTPPDFSLSATPASQSTYRGGSVTYTLQLASLLPSNPFTTAVVLSASNLPSGASAIFTPSTVMPGSAPQTVIMTIAVPALVGKVSPLGPDGRTPCGIALATVVLAFSLSRRRRVPRLLALLFFAGALCAGLALSGCGTGNGFAIPTTTSTINVTATGGATSHSTTVNLTIQ